MDEGYGRSLRKLLPDSFEQMEDVVKAKLSSEPGADWGQVPKFAWNFVGSKATEAVHDVLGMDVFEIIARAWAKAVELREYNDPVKYPADKESKTHLFEHKLTANAASGHRSDHPRFRSDQTEVHAGADGQISQR